ncbi:hypothetical protein JOB18_014363 [Solea senegalensis]|uniref:Uncharacterized protein n=1 Tax=Solea senegalensis TaxID=28829 RepID=A0AAV6R4I1_SOLSE|nr:uncharacterized protein si:ch73-345f18.3 [Solea senegalensis]KAG7500291.1 hypothetical protein JOB18_014363 [Solea senegalensis]
MFRSFCCCCFLGENSVSERRPLLQPRPSDLSEAVSARQIPSTHSAQRARQSGRLVLRRVGVPELDQRFSDVTETFNEQQHHYESMVQHISSLRQSCECSHGDMLAFSECVAKVKEEHQAKYKVSLKMKGYDFCLSVVPVGLNSECAEGPEEILPPHLKLAQDELRGTSERARSTISRGTMLQELFGWLLRSSDQMAEQVKEAAPSYQEQGRLSENLEENMREVRRVKELSLGYRQQAGEILTEAAQIAGANL